VRKKKGGRKTEIEFEKKAMKRGKKKHLGGGSPILFATILAIQMEEKIEKGKGGRS